MTEVAELDNESITSFLNSIRYLEIGPNEMGGFIRQIYKRTDLELPTRLFEALRTAVWSLLRLPEPREEELYNWYSLLRKVAALYTAQEDVKTETRIEVLADLILQSHRFSGYYEGTPNSSTVNQILELLAGYTFLSCAEVSRITGILPINVSRITNTMAFAGLIKKQGYGQSALLSPLK